jgi:hypothetical protein
MNHAQKRGRGNKVSIGLTLLIALGIFAGGLMSAQSVMGQQWKNWPAYYPDAFDGEGILNYVFFAKHQIVLGDSTYKLSTTVGFYTMEVENASSSWFKPGKRIGYLKNSKGEITALYLLE